MTKASNSGYITTHNRDLLGFMKLNYDFDRYVKGLSVYAMGSVTVQERSTTFRTSQSPVYSYGLTENGDPVYNRFGTMSPMNSDYKAVGNYQQLWASWVWTMNASGDCTTSRPVLAATPARTSTTTTSPLCRRT